MRLWVRCWLAGAPATSSTPPARWPLCCARRLPAPSCWPLHSGSQSSVGCTATRCAAPMLNLPSHAKPMWPVLFFKCWLPAYWTVLIDGQTPPCRMHLIQPHTFDLPRRPGAAWCATTCAEPWGGCGQAQLHITRLQLAMFLTTVCCDLATPSNLLCGLLYGMQPCQ